MGVDYYSRTVIGVCLPNEDELPKAKIMVRKKAFEHDYDKSRKLVQDMIKNDDE